MIEIRRYEDSDKQLWNEFVSNSRIDTFLFDRNFMDYHADRFADSSYLFYRKGKLAAVLPGNIDGEVFYSHQGLTYGGMVISKKMTAVDVMAAFTLLNETLKQRGVKEVVYKPVPFIYHLHPSQEDIYALYRLGAEKIGCNLSSTIFQNNRVSFTESRKSGLRKARRENIEVSEADDFEAFWKMLEENLMRLHGKKPVHDFEEISLLKNNFPDQIKLFCAKMDGEVVGGTLLFIMSHIVHVQYISANEQGKFSGALDLLFDELIVRLFPKYPCFDFGHSTEEMGNYLNENLIFQKRASGEEVSFTKHINTIFKMEVSNGFVVNPDLYSLPAYRIGPFTSRDLSKNHTLIANPNPDNQFLDEYLQARFGDIYQYTLNGRQALNLALKHYELNENDVVTILTTSQNFYISSCVTSEIEKFCRWNREVNKDTKLILVNHEFGYIYPEMQYLISLGIPIIEDCCTTFFSQDVGNRVGSYGDFAIYSFSKFFPLQLGGLLIKNAIYEDVEKPIFDKEGIDYVKTVVSFHLTKEDELLRKRKEIYDYALRVFDAIGFSERFETTEITTPSVLLLKNNNIVEDLDDLKTTLRNHGIQSSIFYGEDAFFLPSHQNLSENAVDYFAEVIKQTINNQ